MMAASTLLIIGRTVYRLGEKLPGVITEIVPRSNFRAFKIQWSDGTHSVESCRNLRLTPAGTKKESNIGGPTLNKRKNWV